VEAVAEHPGEQAQVLADVAGDPEQREAALVGAERDLERVRVERERGAAAAGHLQPHRRAQAQPRRPAPRLHRRRAAPHLARRGGGGAEWGGGGGVGVGVGLLGRRRPRYRGLAGAGF